MWLTSHRAVEANVPATAAAAATTTATADFVATFGADWVAA